MKKILRELKREFPGSRIETTGGNHLRVRLVNGKSVFTSSTPSCPHYLKHIRGDVRRLMKELVNIAIATNKEK
jgi:hypothetical protein